MNIGTIVSTVQSEPLEELLGEEVPSRIVEEVNKSIWQILTNEEITPEIREDIFA